TRCQIEWPSREPYKVAVRSNLRVERGVRGCSSSRRLGVSGIELSCELLESFTKTRQRCFGSFGGRDSRLPFSLDQSGLPPGKVAYSPLDAGRSVYERALTLRESLLQEEAVFRRLGPWHLDSLLRKGRSIHSWSRFRPR
ncbi:hypothetical protein ACFL59_11055, partial [Planctomycetota bacterium]